MLIPPEGFEEQFQQTLARTPEGQEINRRIRWFRMEQSGALGRIAGGNASWQDLEGPLTELFHDAVERTAAQSLLFRAQVPNEKGQISDEVREILAMIEGNRSSLEKARH